MSGDPALDPGDPVEILPAEGAELHVCHSRPPLSNCRRNPIIGRNRRSLLDMRRGDGVLPYVIPYPVAGGARGVGLAITRALIAHGVRVHVFDVASGAGDDAAAYTFHRVDITDSAAVAEAVSKLPPDVSPPVTNPG